MVNLNESHFHEMHTFRLEWQPGPDGYLHWYMDDKFRFGIEQSSLEPEGTQIPIEPSYVIFNTAISTSWGFPNPPPGCTEYDCKDPEKRCGFAPGFCDTLPAEYKIDHVRIYQDKNNSYQTLGCNPKDYPTKRFIAAHAFRYLGTTDRLPLVKVRRGRGRCKTDRQCGEGICKLSRCKCNPDWTGPNCLV